MGFSLKKAVKSVTKPVSKVTSAVGKIAQGKVAEGVGDITQTAARTGLDIATGGNKGQIDGISGGLLTSAENAARGNTGDASRVGLVGGATFFGGPLAGLAVNSVLANGGTLQDAGYAALLNGQGGEMSIFNDINGFLGGNSALSKLANSALSGLAGKPQPIVSSSVDRTPPPTIIQAPAPATDWKKWGMIGGGALALVLAVAFLARGRR